MVASCVVSIDPVWSGERVPYAGTRLTVRTLARLGPTDHQVPAAGFGPRSVGEVAPELPLTGGLAQNRLCLRAWFMAGPGRSVILRVSQSDAHGSKGLAGFREAIDGVRRLMAQGAGRPSGNACRTKAFEGILASYGSGQRAIPCRRPAGQRRGLIGKLVGLSNTTQAFFSLNLRPTPRD